MANRNIIIIEIPFLSPAFDEVLALRNRILRKPLKLVFQTQDIKLEYRQMHFACYSSNFQLLGCLVVKKLDDKVVKMRQVAVDFPFQRKGIGQALVCYSERWAKRQGYRKMVLNAREIALPFYGNQGYRTLGDPFKEVGIVHFAMEKAL